VTLLIAKLDRLSHDVHFPRTPVSLYAIIYATEPQA